MEIHVCHRNGGDLLATFCVKKNYTGTKRDCFKFATVTDRQTGY